MRLPRILLSLLPALLLTGCDRASGTNLLVIVSDTLRADAIDCAEEPTSTPNLCRLAARGVEFQNAYSHAPGTLRSSVAMLTGNHAFTYSRFEAPLEHGNDWVHVPEQEPLLAETLREAGYETPAFVENQLVAATNAMQGFDVHDQESLDSIDRRSVERRLGVDLSRYDTRTVAAALAHLLSASDNFYMLLWILDPHAIYSPPESYADEIEVDLDRLARPREYYQRLGHFDRPQRDLGKLEDALPSLSAYERQYLHLLYEKEVEWLDERVGFLLRVLEETGLSANTIVAFTSDHGEAFGEHKRFLHGTTLYEEMVRVPLILAGPGVARGKTVDARVSNIDLTPTLADLVGCDCLAETRGQSLRAVMEASDSARSRYVYLANPGRQPADALVHDGFKLIANTQRGVVKLFDLSADPEERVDLSAARPDVTEQMLERLAEIRSADGLRQSHVKLLTEGQALDETRAETLEALEALGYLD